MTARNKARRDLFAAIVQLEEATRAQRLARAHFNLCRSRFKLEELRAGGGR